MHLKSLELTGFKSFAKKTGLDFKTPISAIVGPNGSGKSNVAEAFRFALGEQSIKSLRGKKTEDLIFNGSKDLPRGNRASVKLTFDNRKRLFNLDYDEVILERIIYRDSSSEYLINGTQVRLRDIIELLASAHIGASGHQIISQGEADRVLTANPKERRAMVEDALGLKIYQYKRQESEKKLIKTEENIKQVESLRKEIAPHLRFLKKQVEKVEKALAMKEELKSLYRDYLKREEVYLSHEKKTVEEARREPAAKLKSLDEELKKAKETVASSKGLDHKSDQLINLESGLQNSRREKDRLTREIGRLEGMIDFEKRRIEKAQKLAETESDTMVPVSSVESLVSEIKSEAGRAEAEENISNLRDLIKSLLARLEKFVKDSRNFSGQKETGELKAEIKELEEKRHNLEQELKAVISTEEKQQKDYVEVKDSIEKEKDINREAEKAIFRIMADQNEIHAIMQAIQTKEDKLIIEETNFKREVQEGLVLVGREISAFHDFNPVDDTGRVLSQEEIVRELRDRQEERRKVIEKIKIRLEDSGGGSSEEIMKEYQDV
ncbi:MAG: AAA family ATPase, partial [Candidatus Paceibacterota bacterium]